MYTVSSSATASNVASSQAEPSKQSGQQKWPKRQKRPHGTSREGQADQTGNTDQAVNANQLDKTNRASRANRADQANRIDEAGQTDQTRQPFFTTLWKYCGVSLTQSFVELGVFTALHLVVANNIANTIAVACSATYQFLMNRNLTFKSSSNFTRSVVLFIALWAFNLAFSTALITYAPAVLGISPFVAKIIAMCCQGVWGFLLSRYVIFR